MIAEFGHFALILAFCLACFQTAVPMLGAVLGQRNWMSVARPLVIGQFTFVLISFITLVLLFLNNDFSVSYVAANSNSLLPVQYKVSAVWGAHEGSLLLWVFVLAGWTLAVAMLSRTLPLSLVARVLSIMGGISIGFYLFLLLTSNPFERLLPYPAPEGADLNPLLQDFGLIIHPPMLYMGYVGFSVAFAFALAALLEGRIDAAWSRWVRPWTNVAWMFLTLGIGLGSWWAYYELGWGGWWFWDPVENASFMPWLVGTALIHSLAAAEKRGVFRSWTLLLAIFAFSLSLLGTFLVRSGVLTSVHAFAADPERGVFILTFLGIVVGGSLMLFALKSAAVKGTASYSLLSREMLLLVNNLLLVAATAIILLGTLYPLIADVMDWGKISVGPPYFNLFFVPLALTVGSLLGVGVLMRWKRHPWSALQPRLVLPVVIALGLGVTFPFVYGDGFSLTAFLSVTVFCWIVCLMVVDIADKLRNASSLVEGLKRLRGSYYGMHLAHFGVAACILGAGLTSEYSEQFDRRMVTGDSQQIRNYQFHFGEVQPVKGANYQADQATISVYRDDNLIVVLKPEKRRYLAGGQGMTEAAIDPGLFRDLYVSLAEPLAGGAWAVRIYHKPFVRWIWLGALFMSFGGLIAALDKRYRKISSTKAAGKNSQLQAGAA